MLCAVINRRQLLRLHLARSRWLHQARRRKATSSEALKLKLRLEFDSSFISSFSAGRSCRNENGLQLKLLHDLAIDVNNIWYCKYFSPAIRSSARKFGCYMWTVVWTLAALMYNTAQGMLHFTNVELLYICTIRIRAIVALYLRSWIHVDGIAGVTVLILRQHFWFCSRAFYKSFAA